MERERERERERGEEREGREEERGEKRGEWREKESLIMLLIKVAVGWCWHGHAMYD